MARLRIGEWERCGSQMIYRGSDGYAVCDAPEEGQPCRVGRDAPWFRTKSEAREFIEEWRLTCR